MLALPDEFLQELRNRNDISSVVSGYVQLKRRGRTQVGLCPFHGEKTASFTVYPDTDSFYCFGCGIGGDVINFIRHIENLDYIDAVKYLAQRAGMDMPQDNYDDSMRKLRLRIYDANREAARFFCAQLNLPSGREGLEYLRSRRLTDGTMRGFGLGFAPDSWSALTDYLINKKQFKPSELVAANLSVQSKRGSLIDRFRNRVMFPIIDIRGNVVAFGGRSLTDEKPKYLNTSDTVAFKKSNNLFALNKAKNSKSDKLILCEGYMDVIAIHQAGFKYAVATLGTALTAEQAKIIKRYTDTVVICYDADEAGQKATARAIGILRQENLQIKVLTVPDGKDPDEFIKKHGENGHIRFKMLLEGTGSDVDYRLQKLKDRFDTETTDGKVSFMSAAAKLISSIDNPVERDIYESKLCEENDVTKEEFKRLVSRYLNSKQRKENSEEFAKIKKQLVVPESNISGAYRNGTRSRSEKAEECLIAYLINNLDMVRTVYEKLGEDKISNEFNRRLYRTIVQRVLNGMPASYTDFSGEFTLDENSRIASILAGYSPELSTPQICMDYVDVILKEHGHKSAKELAEQSDDDVQAYINMIREQKLGKKQ